MHPTRYIRMLEYRHVLIESVRHKVKARARPIYNGSDSYLTLCGKLAFSLHFQCFQRLYYGQAYYECASCEYRARKKAAPGKP